VVGIRRHLRLGWRRGQAPARDIRFTNAWTMGALGVVTLLGATALFGSHGYELPWMGRDRDADQTYIRHMTARHAQRIELAPIAADQAQDPHLRKLAMLMVASQAGEIRIFENWWLSWFDAEMPDCTTDERAAMPGFLTPAEMPRVKAAPADRFDALLWRPRANTRARS
jgi:DUF305 family protein family protein